MCVTVLWTIRSVLEKDKVDRVKEQEVKKRGWGGGAELKRKKRELKDTDESIVIVGGGGGWEWKEVWGHK